VSVSSDGSPGGWPLLGGVLVLLAVLGVSVWQAGYLVQVWALRGDHASDSAYIRAHTERAGRPPEQEWVSLSRISPALRRAVIAAEDARFVDHWGVDPFELADALGDSVEAGRFVRGASTITMQLARNLFLSGDRRLGRKAQEIVIALMLEACLGKRRILELYLNVAQWGRRVYGIGAAAHYYFDTDAASLTDEQSAWLAAMLPAPAAYDGNRETPWLRERRAAILAQMNSVAVP
jgi:monofunctional biosynthetic peptidoglycan transglycosylase